MDISANHRSSNHRIERNSTERATELYIHAHLIRMRHAACGGTAPLRWRPWRSHTTRDQSMTNRIPRYIVLRVRTWAVVVIVSIFGSRAARGCCRQMGAARARVPTWHIPPTPSCSAPDRHAPGVGVRPFYSAGPFSASPRAAGTADTARREARPHSQRRWSARGGTLASTRSRGSRPPLRRGRLPRSGRGRSRGAP